MFLSVLFSLYLSMLGTPVQAMDAGGTPFATAADAGGTPFVATTSGTTSISSTNASGDAGGTPF